MSVAGTLHTLKQLFQEQVEQALLALHNQLTHASWLQNQALRARIVSHREKPHV